MKEGGLAPISPQAQDRGQAPISREIGASPQSLLSRTIKFHFHDDHRFRTWVTVFLAGLTFVTSLIVFINVRASFAAAAATRDARLLGIRYLSQYGRSLWRAAEERDLMNSYQETSGLMMQAEVYERLAKEGDRVFYKMMHDSLEKSRSLLLAQGELAKPPYFNASLGAFDYFQFYLDRVVVPAAELKEREDQKWAESAFWSAKATSFTAGLAIMAVAVFLMTLSLVIHAHVRIIIGGAGMAMVIVVLAITSFTAARQWHGREESAIKLLAQASGSALYAQVIINYNGDTNAAAFYAGKAKADVDTIVAAGADYPAAILLRARVHSVLGEARYFAGQKDAARSELEQAAADLDRAIAGGKTEGYTYWSKGYVNFLLGRHDASIAALDRALELLPRQKFTLGLVKAVELLTAGKAGEARALAEEAIEFALKNPLGSDAVNARTILKNITRFDELQPVEGMKTMTRRLKEASVCLAVLNRARPGEVKAELAPLRFVEAVTDAAGNVTNTVPVEAYKAGTGRASFFVELKGLEKGQSIVRKVFRRAPGQVFWIEELWLGRAESWDGPAEARTLATVENRIPEAGETLAGGDYRLEIYIEGSLKAEGKFKVL